MFILFLASDMFRKYFKLCYVLIIVILLPACGSLGLKGNTTKRVVPKNRNRYYHPKKDKHKSRIKKVKAIT